MQQTRSGRLIRKPARYALLRETYQVVLDNSDDDPTTYEEALEDVDVQEWEKAMDCEMESMGSNFYYFCTKTCAGAPQILIWFKLGLRPFHNSVGVFETDLDETKFSMYAVVSKAYPQNDSGNDE